MGRKGTQLGSFADFLGSMGNSDEEETVQLSNEEIVQKLRELEPIFTGPPKDFKVGDLVQFDHTMKKMSDGGLVNYKWPDMGQPMLVVGFCEAVHEQGSHYMNETVVCLIIKDGKEPLRFSVDPVFLEKYTG